MIDLELLTDGTATARNFDKLRTLLIDTGGQSIGLRLGTDTVTYPGATAGSTVKTVTHGLGRIPVYVGPQWVAGGTTGTTYSHTFEVSNLTTTTFDVQGFGSSAVAAGQTVAIMWVVIG